MVSVVCTEFQLVLGELRKGFGCGNSLFEAMTCDNGVLFVPEESLRDT